MERDHNCLFPKVFNFCTYPIIRIELIWGISYDEGRLDNSTLTMQTSKVKSLIRMIFEFVYIFGIILWYKGIESLYMSKSTYRSKVSDIWYDRVCDPIKEEATKSISLETASKLSYLKPRLDPRTFEVQYLFIMLQKVGTFISRFKTRRKAVFIKEYTALLEKLPDSMSKIKRIQPERVYSKVCRIKLLSYFFRVLFFFNKGIKVCYQVCFYEEYCMALNLAAKVSSVKSVDLQHGIQGSMHPAYFSWNIGNNLSHDLLPNEFQCWDEVSTKNIKSWNLPGHQATQVGYQWVRDWKNPEWLSRHAPELSIVEDLPIVLVTLQPLGDFLPDQLLYLIRHSSLPVKWYLRLHPRQLNQLDLFERRIASMGLLGKVEVRQASTMPLPFLLSRSVSHITQWSSVVIEAAQFKVPSIVLDLKGKELFKDYLSDRIAYFINLENDQLVRKVDKYIWETVLAKE